MLSSWLPALYVCLIYTDFVQAQAKHFWVQPPNFGSELIYNDGPSYKVNSVLELKWSMDLDTYQIWMWQQNLNIRSARLGDTIFTKQAGGSPVTAFNWTVTSQAFDLSQSAVFFFAMGPTSNLDDKAMISHYFNLTGAATSTSSASGTIVSSTNATASFLSTPSTRTPTSSPIFNQSQGGSDNMLKLGLGLGLGIPLLIVLTVLVSLLFRRNRSKKASHHADIQKPPISDQEIVWNHGFYNLQRHEIDGADIYVPGKSWNSAPLKHHQTVPVEIYSSTHDVR